VDDLLRIGSWDLFWAGALESFFAVVLAGAAGWAAGSGVCGETRSRAEPGWQRKASMVSSGARSRLAAVSLAPIGAPSKQKV
jgi:hypothetical protein